MGTKNEETARTIAKIRVYDKANLPSFSVGVDSTSFSLLLKREFQRKMWQLEDIIIGLDKELQQKLLKYIKVFF